MMKDTITDSLALCAVQDAQANPPPLPEELQTAPADDTTVDMDTTDDVATIQASASASMPSTSQPLAAATSAPMPSQIPSTTHPLLAPLPQAKPAAADTLTAQINSRIAAAAAAVQPAGSGTSSMPSAPAALPRPIAPFLAPLPALAPHWPGYYQPAPPYAFPHMPYPYMPYPLPYVGPQIQQPASAPLPASAPHQAAPGERHKLSAHPVYNLFHYDNLYLESIDPPVRLLMYVYCAWQVDLGHVTATL